LLIRIAEVCITLKDVLNSCDAIETNRDFNLLSSGSFF
jgi:hypothetical protein